MTRKDLKPSLKRRLDSNPSCPICCDIIADTDKILITVKRKRRCKEVTFYHERCLIDGEKEEQLKDTK